MKRRVFTLFLSLIILGATLAAYSHSVYAAEIQQYRQSNEIVCAAIAPKLIAGVQENMDHLFVTIAPFSLTRSPALHEKIENTYPSICKSVKAYIIFRVFRN